MPQWEYRTIDLNDAPDKRDEIMLLNEAGADRWELVTIVANRIAYMRREIEDTALPSRRRKSDAET